MRFVAAVIGEGKGLLMKTTKEKVIVAGARKTLRFTIERRAFGYAVRFKRFGLIPSYLGGAIGWIKPKLFLTRHAAIDAFLARARAADVI